MNTDNGRDSGVQINPEQPGEEGFTYATRVGAWTVRAVWPFDAATGGPKKLIIEAAEDAAPGDVARGISTTVLRQINPAEGAPPPEFVEQVVSGLGAVNEAGRALDQFGELAAKILARDGVSDLYLSVLASTYVLLADAGVKGLTALLADRMGRKPQTVKDHLKQARRRDLLTTVAGKAGGELTDKARALLANKHDDEHDN
uniref:Uncharacterized protein n=1 Tax=Streptomyces sp. NBC_00003 TaxID=2903608 RepID=A0AAU2VBN9_9ACTN